MEQDVQSLQKQLADSQWYLGEEMAKVQRLEGELSHERHICREKQEYLQRLEEDNRKLRQQWEESQWYLSEERNKATCRS